MLVPIKCRVPNVELRVMLRYVASGTNDKAGSVRLLCLLASIKSSVYLATRAT